MPRVSLQAWGTVSGGAPHKTGQHGSLEIKGGETQLSAWSSLLIYNAD